MRRRTLALIALAGMLVLAGCSSGGTTTAPETTTDAETATLTATETPTETEATTDSSNGSDAVDAEQLRSETLAAMDSLEAYHVVSNRSIATTANNQTQQRMVESDSVFDRVNQRLRINQTASAGGTSQQGSLYYLNESVYQYNPGFVEQYGSEWITGEVNETRFDFGSQDMLAGQRTFLTNASVAVDGTTTVEGTDVYHLTADVDKEATREAAIAQLGGTAQGIEYNVTGVDQQFWIDTETDRPVRITNTFTASITRFGQTANVSVETEMTFDYDGEVDVTLPEAAESAVTVGNESST